MTTQRLVDFAGTVFNFRDVGTMTTSSGIKLRTGRLFRSDNLGGLVEADREQFVLLGIRTVIDLRQQVELDSQGRAPQWAGDRWHNVALNNPVWYEEDYSPEAGVAAFLVARYHEAAEHAAADIVRVLTIVADPDSGPTVVHCLGGRDRTGVVIAFILELLGVSDEDIAADYTLTEQGLKRFERWQLEHRPHWPPLAPFIASTPAQAMLTFLTQLRQRHGSVRAYLVNAGLTEEHIVALQQELLLDEESAEPADD